MSAVMKVVKGTVVIEGTLLPAQWPDLERRYGGRTKFELLRGRYENLHLLEPLAKIEHLGLINTRVGTATSLAGLPTLRSLFINTSAVAAGFEFLADLAQVEELHLLNHRGPLTLPALDGMAALKRFRVWGCKGFTDISVLAEVPQLEEVELIDVGLEPEDLEPLIAKPTIRYVTAQFASQSRNARFTELLAKYGKGKYPEGS